MLGRWSGTNSVSKPLYTVFLYFQCPVSAEEAARLNQLNAALAQHDSVANWGPVNAQREALRDQMTVAQNRLVVTVHERLLRIAAGIDQRLGVEHTGLGFDNETNKADIHWRFWNPDDADRFAVHLNAIQLPGKEIRFDRDGIGVLGGED